jgi:hypothetical protein
MTDKPSSKFRGKERVRRWSVGSDASDVSCGCGCGGEAEEDKGVGWANGNAVMKTLPCGKTVMVKKS